MEKRYNFELIYYAVLKRVLKKKYIAKRNFKKSRKLWFFLKKNSPISKKSKNARMGKGKGTNLRWVVRLKKKFCIRGDAEYEFLFFKKNLFFYRKKNSHET